METDSLSDIEAASWAYARPEDDPTPRAPEPVPEAEDVVPNHHSASAEAAALRWREQHEDEPSE
jgi:hypothetical protein